MIDPDEPNMDPDVLEFIYCFAIVWSLGAALKPESRKKFEGVFKSTTSRIFPQGSLFDYEFDFKVSKTHISWSNSLAEFKYPEDGKFFKIMVPTADTKRFSYLLNFHI
jgi:dynein heavy chain